MKRRLRAALESAGHDCWDWKTNNLAGAYYGKGIIQAINDRNCLVLLLTAKANQSDHIVREVGRAADIGKPIYVLKRGKFKLSEDLTYPLSQVHMLEAENYNNLDAAIASLVKHIGGVDEQTEPSKLKPHYAGRRWVRSLLVILMAPILAAVVYISFYRGENWLEFGGTTQQEGDVEGDDSPRHPAVSPPEVVPTNGTSPADTAARDIPETPLVGVVQRSTLVQREPSAVRDGFYRLSTGERVAILPYESSRWRRVRLEDGSEGFVPKGSIEVWAR